MIDEQDLETRLRNLEQEKNALEWMVVQLAKRMFIRDADPIASAAAFKDFVDIVGQGYVTRTLSGEDRTAEGDEAAAKFASEIQTLAERMLAELQDDLRPIGQG